MSGHRVAHNAVRAGTRYYQSRRKGKLRRLRRDVRRGVAAFTNMRLAFDGLRAAAQQVAQQFRALGERVQAAQTDPALPLIDRIRARMAAHPGEGCVEVARALGEPRILLVAVMMRMVTLARARGSVQAHKNLEIPHRHSTVNDGPETPGSLRASRRVREGA